MYESESAKLMLAYELHSPPGASQASRSTHAGLYEHASASAQYRYVLVAAAILVELVELG